MDLSAARRELRQRIDAHYNAHQKLLEGIDPEMSFLKIRHILEEIERYAVQIGATPSKNSKYLTVHDILLAIKKEHDLDQITFHSIKSRFEILMTYGDMGAHAHEFTGEVPEKDLELSNLTLEYLLESLYLAVFQDHRFKTEILASIDEPESIELTIGVPISENENGSKINRMHFIAVMLISIMSVALIYSLTSKKHDRNTASPIEEHAPAPEASVLAKKHRPIEWIEFEGGSFRMGSDEGQKDEAPAHTAEVAGFALSKTEITVAQYGACLHVGACPTPATGEGCNWGVEGREDHPINCITHQNAEAFARWAGARLPNEAEWEFAARGGAKARLYPWGKAVPDCERAIFSMRGARYKEAHGCGARSTWAVCSKPKGKTPEGLCDMAGNVWEWTANTYCLYPQLGREETCNRNKFVVRGGSWGNGMPNMRGSDRFGAIETRNEFIGFRVARSGAER